jgi:serine/threonine protein phosphatase PrpC
MLLAYANTDTGLMRSGNEDSFLSLPKRGLFAVADGLGGQAYGEVASRMAVDLLCKEKADAFADLHALLQHVSASIRSRGRELGGGEIGTTLTLAIVEGGFLRIAQIGDSIAFMTAPDGTRLQLTREHTVAEERRSAGRRDIESYMEHILTQCLGQADEVMPDVLTREFPIGARLLLCSDGITKTVDRCAILETLQSAATPREAVDSLIKAANASGGPDNATAVAVFKIA